MSLEKQLGLYRWQDNQQYRHLDRTQNPEKRCPEDDQR